jgi:hypothetical protein
MNSFPFSFMFGKAADKVHDVAPEFSKRKKWPTQRENFDRGPFLIWTSPFEVLL